MSMYITCLDLEGVLVPEIWIAFAEATGIPELKRTTRDEPDYDKLMKYRINILATRREGVLEALPGPNHCFQPDETMFILGSDKDIQKFLNH